MIHLLIGGPEEELVGIGSGQQDDVLVGELERTDVTAFVAHPLHQADGIGAELLEMAVFFFAAGHPQNVFHDSSGYFSC